MGSHSSNEAVKGLRLVSVPHPPAETVALPAPRRWLYQTWPGWAQLKQLPHLLAARVSQRGEELKQLPHLLAARISQRVEELKQRSHLLAVRVEELLNSEGPEDEQSGLHSWFSDVSLPRAGAADPAADPSEAPFRAYLSEGARQYVWDLPPSPWASHCRAFLSLLPQLPAVRATVWLARALAIGALLRAAGAPDALKQLGKAGVATLVGSVWALWAVQLTWWVLEVAYGLPDAPHAHELLSTDAPAGSEEDNRAVGTAGPSAVAGTSTSPKNILNNESAISRKSETDRSTGAVSSTVYTVTTLPGRTRDSLGNTATTSFSGTDRLRTARFFNPPWFAAKGCPIHSRSCKTCALRSKFSNADPIPSKSPHICPIHCRSSERVSKNKLLEMTSMCPGDVEERISVVDATLAALRFISLAHRIPRWERTSAADFVENVGPCENASSSSSSSDSVQ